MKLVAIYAAPQDPEAFDTAYFETHVPLIKQVPGLLDMQAVKLTRVVVGNRAPYMVVTMSFADKDALKAAMASPEMAAAGANLDSFAQGQYTLCFGEGL